VASEGKTGYNGERVQTYHRRNVKQLGGLAMHDFRQEGGLAHIHGVGPVSILPPMLRKDWANDYPGNPYSSANIMRYQTGDPSRLVKWRDLSRRYFGLGKEAEGHIVDEDGLPSNATNAYLRGAEIGSDLDISVSPELLNFTLEIGTDRPAETLDQLRRQITEGLVFMDGILDDGQSLLPTSTLPGYDIDLDRDITDHPYVHRMAYQVLGKRNSENFTGVGPQLHVEIPSHVHGARALMWTENALMPLKALAQSSPYDGTTLFYDIADRLPNVPRGIPNDGQWANLRDLQRSWGLGTGGVAKYWPDIEAFSDPAELDSFINERNRTTFADRAFGGHTKRIRTTLAGAPSGTLEIPDFDTAGFRIERLIALDEVTKHAVRAMMQIDITNVDQQEYLARRFPAVFHPMTSDNDVDQLVRTANRNQFRLARAGKNAGIEGSDDETYTTAQALEQLYSFCFEINQVPISKESREELARGLKPPSQRHALENYYRTGHGTLAEAYRVELATIKGEKTDQGLLLATNRTATRALKAYLARKRNGLKRKW
jgi:hypothetical protein